MEHNIIDITATAGMQRMQLLRKDNNLDGLDNLQDIPETPAVYALCSRVNNEPANPRFVGATPNLRETVIAHFNNNDSDNCLNTFLSSVKLKELLFEILPQATPELLEEKKNKWQTTLKPECNEILNKVF